MNDLSVYAWIGGVFVVIAVIIAEVEWADKATQHRKQRQAILLFFVGALLVGLCGCGEDDFEPRGSFFIDHAAIIDMTSGPDAFNIKLVGGSRVWIDRCCGTVEIVKGEGLQVEVW